VHPRANALDLILSNRVGDRRQDIIQCGKQRRTALEQYTG
jgi:hypothetical protein